MIASVGQTATPPGATRQTILALFDDSIDAEQALMALRKTTGAPEQISLVVRDRATEDQNSLEATGALARVLVATALDAVGGWLQGLASLIVPRRGTYLVAGPIGAALTGIGPAGRAGRDAAAAGVATEAAAQPGATGLLATLTEFGFGTDEADYIERRLEAGAALIAITATDVRRLERSRRLFADHSAVHIGQADTDEYLASEVTAMLASAAHASAGSEIVVADAVAPLRHLCQATDDAEDLPGACGSDAIDGDGHHLGQIEDLLGDMEETGPDGAPLPRYVVVATGGVFGLGRRHVPIPAPLCELGSRPVQVDRTRAQIEAAPVLTLGRAFSRREEEAICAFFEVPRYWET